MALAVATFVGLHWWSLAVVVFIALLVARPATGDAGLESAISAMLILGSVGAEVAAQTRFLTTIIGTIVGIVLPLVLPRRVQTADLTRDLRRIALRLRSVYRDAARYLTVNSPNTQATRQWLDSVRAITPLISQADQVLDEAADVQHLNTRQMFQANIVPLLRGGLDTLERTLLATRQALTVMPTTGEVGESPQSKRLRRASGSVRDRSGRDGSHRGLRGSAGGRGRRQCTTPRHISPWRWPRFARPGTTVCADAR